MAESASLIVRRGQIKGQLTRIANYIRDNEENPDSGQIAIRLQKTIEAWHDFQQVQAQIDEETEKTDESEKYGGEFEELYYNNVLKCIKIMRGASIGATSSSSSNRGSYESKNDDCKVHSNPKPVQAAKKLAAIEIPTFSGVYTE